MNIGLANLELGKPATLSLHIDIDLAVAIMQGQKEIYLYAGDKSDDSRIILGFNHFALLAEQKAYVEKCRIFSYDKSAAITEMMKDVEETFIYVPDSAKSIQRLAVRDKYKLERLLPRWGFLPSEKLIAVRFA